MVSVVGEEVKISVEYDRRKSFTSCAIAFSFPEIEIDYFSCEEKLANRALFLS